ncbi:MAG: acylneuraminate cytidylyltransferase family protein [Sedimentisphaerales bacterium]|nr:acylneuraminate cytidylyltransferase family protein [Sedimentisphaerales bacterium]
MQTLAIIPARANSRGVPDKNIRPLLGKPVIAYSIEAALAARLITRVAVSSDDLRIRNICDQYQVEFIERPTELAADASRIDDAMRHVCQYLDQKENYRPDAVVLLYANVPVRADGVIDRAVEKLQQTGADSVQSFSPVGKFHPYWLYTFDADGRAGKFIDNAVYRRQELPPVYCIDGAVAVVRYNVLMAAAGNPDPHAFFGRDRRGVIQPHGSTVDIDHPLDFHLAEALLRQ